MTYQELLEFLQSLDSTDSRLSDKVTIYDAAANEFYGLVELMETINDDILHSQHLYLAFDNE
jgi:hypothetical protein